MRCGDHLPPHKYIRNTSTCGTTLTEHLLSTGRRPQTSQKARNSPRTWVGQKKKENTEAKKRDGTAPEPPRRAQAAAINADTRDRHEMLRLLLLPPRRLYASIGHYPHLPSWEPVQHATARAPRSRDNFPRRTHGTPQVVATSCQPLPAQACPALQL